MSDRWNEMKGGYRVPYDPRPAIAQLGGDEKSVAEAWEELWSELHHQGDVGEASYASVPLLVDACKHGPRDWNFYGLVAVIEVERRRIGNPELPEELVSEYKAALASARDLALTDLAKCTDHLTTRTALSVIALASGEFKLGALIANLDSGELDELLEQRMGWSTLYKVRV